MGETSHYFFNNQIQIAMTTFEQKTAVILFNLGGPDSLESVESFLFNLFHDKAIINLWQPFRFMLAKLIAKKRAPKSKKIYEIIGGKSPLLDIGLSQAHALEKELSFLGNFKVFVSMRYFHPFASEVIAEVIKYDLDQAILLPLYPQFSSATSASSLQEFVTKFFAEQKKIGKNIPIKTICCYPCEPDFIRAHSMLIKQTIMRFYEDNFGDFRLLFSAHGLPQKLINAGDPYQFQIEMTTQKIVQNLSEIFSVPAQKIDFQTCYQSKVGPLRWTSPSLEHEIKRAALDQKIPVIIPVSFVSDCLETLVELDCEYKKLAEELGIKNYLRVPSLNLDGYLIKSLVKICQKVSKNNKSEVFSGENPERICPKNFLFCINPNSCVA